VSIIVEGLNDSDTSSDEDSAGGDDSEQTLVRTGIALVEIQRSHNGSMMRGE